LGWALEEFWLILCGNRANVTAAAKPPAGHAMETLHFPKNMNGRTLIPEKRASAGPVAFNLEKP
jgi:hypothetical protein